MTSTIIIGSDHAGVDLKAACKALLEGQGWQVVDCGTHTADSVDYPDITGRVLEAFHSQNARYAVLMCGTGIGMSIAANRDPKVRAALCHNVETATLSRQHNDANILVLGARIVTQETALACLAAFIKTDFEGGRHAARVAKLSHPH